MKKSLLAILALCSVAGQVSAQDISAVRDSIVRHKWSVGQEGIAMRIPDEEDITVKIFSTDSPWYYPSMLLRYMTGDLDLTPEHYYYLYYGFAYDNNYDAHKELPGESVVYDIFARTQAPSRAEALAIIEAGKENMLVDPFNPGNINMMTWAYEIVGDTINAIISAHRFRGIIGAITSSGSGQRESSPWHILRFSHANDIVAAQGFKIANRQVRTLDVEYIQVEKNRRGVKGYFFNFERVYWKPYDGPRKQPKSNWEINGMPVRRRSK